MGKIFKSPIVMLIIGVLAGYFLQPTLEPILGPIFDKLKGLGGGSNSAGGSSNNDLA